MYPVRTGSKRFDRFRQKFCRRVKVGGEFVHVCDEIFDGIYAGDRGRVLYADSIEKLDKFFYCDTEEKNRRINACVWRHKDSDFKDYYFNKVSDIVLPETDLITVRGKRKPVSAVRLGISYVDRDLLKKALEVFVGYPVRVIYTKSRKDKFSPIVVRNMATDEVIVISPYISDVFWKEVESHV